MRPMLLSGLAVAACAASAHAQFAVFTASLTGAQETPPVTTPATGSATLTLNTATNQWTMSVTFAGLTTPTVMAHIHRAPAGVAGPVIIGLDGMALGGGQPAWSLIPLGVTSFSTPSPAAAPFAFPPDELDDLRAGNLYVNIHSSQFPGGEIRGQLVPQPGAGMLALAGLRALRRRR